MVARATDSDSAARYLDAGDLALDLRRYFEGRRVEAHHCSRLELLQRLLSAWRLPRLVGAAGLLLLLVAIGLAASALRREGNPRGAHGSARPPPRRARVHRHSRPSGDVARTLWPNEGDCDALRRRWDVLLVRLRDRLRAANLRSDLVRTSRGGLLELVLQPGDRVEDRS